MASGQQKAFCVLRFAQCESVITVQRDFRTTYGVDAPTAQSIRRWHEQFRETGCLCKGKSPGRPRVGDADVERIRHCFTRSPQKSVRRAARQLNMPSTSVWRVLRRRLHMKPYKIQLLQALRRGDKERRVEFCRFVLGKMEDDDSFVPRLVFSDEATFHLNGKVNRHNVRIWGTEQPHEIVQHERDSPKFNVFCAVSREKVYGPFFFVENTVTGITYLDMLENYLFPQLETDSNDFIYQQDGAPPHWHLEVREFLNQRIPGRWIGRTGQNDAALHYWPPRSPDLTVCDFFLWGFIKDSVYVPPLPTTMNELRHRITAAVEAVTQDMLAAVWDQFEYRLDICRASQGGHIEHL